MRTSPRPLPERPARRGIAVYRHPFLVRLAHWTNALCMLVLLLSGLQILNAHPALYWGEVSHFADPAAAIVSEMDAAGAMRGYLDVGGARFETTGFLGVSATADGVQAARAFPSWLTLPSGHDLGAARSWHFFFAWVLVASATAYLSHGALTGRLRTMMWPSAADLRNLPRSVLDHVRLRFDHAEPGYNVLQKLAYGVVIFGLAPVMVLTGLAMAPTLDARIHLLSELFGGRQSARTVHFLAASGLVAFVAIHLAMVVVSGPINSLRSMVTGWFVLRREKP